MKSTTLTIWPLLNSSCSHFHSLLLILNIKSSPLLKSYCMSQILFLHLSLQGSLHVKYLSVFYGPSLHFPSDFSCFCSLPVCFHLCLCAHPLSLLQYMIWVLLPFSPLYSLPLMISHIFFITITNIYIYI